MDLKNHSIYNELVALGIVNPAAVTRFYPAVRDRDDVGVLRCNQSGVIFLDRVDHVETSYYADKEGTSYWSSSDRTAGLRLTWEDDHRRAAQIRELVSDKAYADVGSGLGGILDLMKEHAAGIHAVEPQNDARALLKELGYPAYASIKELSQQDTKFDLITLFHVFEHITDPLDSLKMLRKALKPGGKVFIEVPHAGDALISLYNLDAFKKFTFWSEHLVLHTRKSLEAYLFAAGFSSVTVSGFQRYPLANHLHWLHKNEPGGHVRLPQMRNAALEEAYAATLAKSDMNDTLIAIATC